MAKHIVSQAPELSNDAPPNLLVLRRVAEEIFDAAWGSSETPTPLELRRHAKRLAAVAKLFDASGTGLH
jgi:hypothetical protein